MGRSVEQAFGVFLEHLTPTEAERRAGAKHRASVRSALDAKLDTRRFVETGSFSHGTGIRGHSDIDALITLAAPRPESSYTALNRVKEALRARFPLTLIKIRRPAVVVEFGGGYETWEVIPGFVTGRGTMSQCVYDVPSPKPGTAWIDSAPDEHRSYVNAANRKPDPGDAKALARLLKAWKYYRNVPISSFYLEMRCAQHMRANTSYVHVWDLCEVLESLHASQLAAMNDPSAASGRIRACSSDSTRADALIKLARAATRARGALDSDQAGKLDSAFYYLDKLFAGRFPSR
jgi:hypothetical protein